MNEHELATGYTPHDDFFGAPYIDVDKQYERPLPHRYLHGGFAGTDTRFSLYMPPADVYQGRHVQTFGGALGGNEHSARAIAAVLNPYHNAFSNGAYLVESNQGHIGPSLDGLKGDFSVLNGRADTETARFSFHVAEQLYGRRPHHSYCYGGSGGGNFTLRCMEIEGSVFHGGVPYMFGGSVFGETMNAARLLRTKIDDVVDAMSHGGSGQPFVGLDTAQRDALASLYRAGFQRGGEFQLRLPMPEISWPTCSDMTNYRAVDAAYFDDFWSQPGHLGADGGLDDDIIEVRAHVARIATAADATHTSTDGFVSRMLTMVPADTALGIVLEGVDTAAMTGATLTVASGKAAGRRMYNFLVIGDVLVPAGLGTFFDPALVDGIEPGDEIVVDNRDFLAYCYLARHRVFHPLSRSQYEVAGTAVYPMRGTGPGGSLGIPFTATFPGKVIMLQHLLDRPCWPTVAVQYHRDVTQNLGAATDDRFRLWWTDKAMHGPTDAVTGNTTRAIDYGGHVSQALRDVIAWVEDGIAPAATYDYDVVDGQVVIADDDLSRRGGIQPRLRASVDGRERVEVRVGETVRLTIDAAVPAGTGTIVGAEWDLDGSASWSAPCPGIDGTSTAVRVTIEHRYDTPGCYFATARVWSHRDGDMTGVYERIENLAGVRVIVS